jgi:hypothetical protein
MKANSNFRYLFLFLLSYTFFSSFSFVNFRYSLRTLFSSSFTFYLLLVAKEYLFATRIYASITTLLFNYKKRVHPLFVSKKTSMRPGKNYYSPKYQI